MTLKRGKVQKFSESMYNQSLSNIWLLWHCFLKSEGTPQSEFYLHNCIFLKPSSEHSIKKFCNKIKQIKVKLIIGYILILNFISNCDNNHEHFNQNYMVQILVFYKEQKVRANK